MSGKSKKRSAHDAGLSNEDSPEPKKQEQEPCEWLNYSKSTQLRFHIRSEAKAQLDKLHFELCDDVDAYSKYGSQMEQKWDEHIKILIAEAVAYAQMPASEAQEFEEMVWKRLQSPTKRKTIADKMSQGFAQMCAVTKGPEFVPKVPETLRHAFLESLIQVLTCEVENFARAFV